MNEAMHAALQRWRDEDHEDTIALSREQVIDLCEEYRAAAYLIEELERRNRELNYELGGARRSYFEERAKNERLRIERITAERDAADYMKRLDKAAGKLLIAENVIVELEEALEPFADAKITYLDAPDGREVKAKHVHGLVYGDFRRARAAAVLTALAGALRDGE